MEINGKFLVGFRNYNKDKQVVSGIVCENSINSIVNESLNSSFIKVDLDCYYYIQGLGFLVRWVSLFANKKTQLLFAIDS